MIITKGLRLLEMTTALSRSSSNTCAGHFQTMRLKNYGKIWETKDINYGQQYLNLCFPFHH